MQLTVTGKQIDTRVVLHEHVEASFGAISLFRNHSRGELNIVRRCLDGNIGWINPKLDPARQRRHGEE